MRNSYDTKKHVATSSRTIIKLIHIPIPACIQKTSQSCKKHLNTYKHSRFSMEAINQSSVAILFFSCQNRKTHMLS